MALSARAHYACIALLDLVAQLRQGRQQPVTVHEISRRHAVSHPFLRQIMNRLRAAGLVTSARGSGGGYQLVVPPEELTLKRVLDAVGESWELRPDETGGATGPAQTLLSRTWDEVNSKLAEELDAFNFADLAEQYLALIAEENKTPDWVI